MVLNRHTWYLLGEQLPFSRLDEDLSEEICDGLGNIIATPTEAKDDDIIESVKPTLPIIELSPHHYNS